MPRVKGRPPADLLVIADCASVAIHHNPTPRCPHGKAWRESDYDRLPESIRSLQCTEPGCESNEFHPHEGESISLRRARSFEDSQALSRFNLGGGAGYDQLIEMVQQYVTGWTWTGITGDPLPLPCEDWPQVARGVTTAELLWIRDAVLVGEDPSEALYRSGGNGSPSPSG